MHVCQACLHGKGSCHIIQVLHSDRLGLHVMHLQIQEATQLLVCLPAESQLA